MFGGLELVYHNVATLIDSGIPIVRVLKMAGAGAKRNLAEIFTSLSQAVSQGQPLPGAMSDFKQIFDPLDIMVTEAGDLSGNLAECMEMLSKWHEFRKRIKRIIISGLLLPIVILHIAAVIAPLPMWFMGKISSSGYLTQVIGALMLFYIPAAIALALMHLRKTNERFGYTIDNIILRVPFLGKAIEYLALSRFCRAFYMLYKAGIPITQSAESSVEVTGNFAMADMLAGAADSAKNGRTLSDGFSKCLPTEFLEVWVLGEETGDLDDVAERLANRFSESAEHRLILFAQWLPKIIYALVSVFIIIQVFKGYATIGTSF